MIEQIVEDIMHQAYKDIIEDISQALTSVIQATMLKAEYTQKALVVALSQIKGLSHTDKNDGRSSIAPIKQPIKKNTSSYSTKTSDLKKDIVEISEDPPARKPSTKKINCDSSSTNEVVKEDEYVKNDKRTVNTKPSFDKKADNALEFVGKLSNLENSLKHQTSKPDKRIMEDEFLFQNDVQANLGHESGMENMMNQPPLDLKQDFAEISGDLPILQFNEDDQATAVPRRRKKSRKLDNGDNIWSCSHCTFKVKKKLLLKLHIKRNHINDEVFYCKECQYSTTTKENLKIHNFGSHSNSEDLKCKECGKRFTQKGAVQMHMRNIHYKIKEYSCSDCDYETAFKKNLGIHAKRRHGEIDKMMPSEVWRYMVKDKDNAKATCNICSRIFKCKTSSNNNLKNHLKLKHKIIVRSSKVGKRKIHWKNRDAFEESLSIKEDPGIKIRGKKSK